MPTERIDAWDTEDQKSLPPGARRRAWRPSPNESIGLFIDNRARESCRRACRAAKPFMPADQIDRRTALALCRQIRTICRWYWANSDYDNQPTFGDIKGELRQFRGRLATTLKAFKKLTHAARKELNGDLIFKHGDRLPKDYVEAVRAGLQELQAASDHVLVPNYEKITPIAVSRCCEALAAMWKEVTGKRLPRTKRADPTGHGLVFRSEGPRCLQAVIGAIDPKVGIDQVITWMVESRGSKTGQK